MLWVVLTCVSGCLTHCKMNHLNPTTLLWENVQNVPKYRDILTLAQNSKIGPHFGRFLGAAKSDWANSFCNVSGISRHKFRLPTTYYSENVEISLFLGLTPFWSVFPGHKNTFLSETHFLTLSCIDPKMPKNTCQNYFDNFNFLWYALIQKLSPRVTRYVKHRIIWPQKALKLFIFSYMHVRFSYLTGFQL